MKKMIFLFFPVILWSQILERWVYKYNGSANNEDRAWSIVYGPDGNIYGAGVTTGNTQDLLVVSLNNSGEERWVYTYDNGYDDQAYSIACDQYGNLYVGGYTSDGEFEYSLVLSLSSNGGIRWVYTDQYGSIRSIIVGGDGNIYTAGNGNIKSITSSGNLIWTYSYPEAVFHSITYGLDGNIYATGEINGRRILVVSLTSSGNVRWSYTYNPPQEWVAEGASIIYAPDGNVYVTGHSTTNATTIYPDLVVISLKSDGSLNWLYTYNGPGDGWDWGNEIIYNFYDGNLYVAGFSADPNGSFLVISLTNQGVERWVYREPNGDIAFSITNDTEGNLYIAGRTEGGISGDIMVVKLSPNGEKKWSYIYNGGENYYDDCRKIICGGDGYLYVAGFSGLYSYPNYYADFTIISLFPQPLGEYHDTFYKEKDFLREVKILYIPTFFIRKIPIKISGFSEKNLKLFFYNSSGREIFSKVYHFTFSIEIENLEKLSKGVYFMEIYSGRKRMGKFKLIKY